MKTEQLETMDVLRSKTPEMVRKEIYIYLLAYNLKSTLMWEAVTAYGVLPLRLSMLCKLALIMKGRSCRYPRQRN